MRTRLLLAIALVVVLLPLTLSPLLDVHAGPPIVLSHRTLLPPSPIQPSVRPAPARALAPLTVGTPITIGVAAGTTGPIPDIGWGQVNAVQLRVDEVNAGGGLVYGGASHAVVLATADDACSASSGPAAANQLLAAGAVAVVGHTCSYANTPAAPIYYAARTAMVSPSATANNLTYLGHDTTFRVVANDNNIASGMARLLIAQQLKRAALVLAPQAPPTMQWSAAFQATYAGSGGTVVVTHTLSSAGGVGPILTDIATRNVEVIVVCNEPGALAADVSRGAADRGMSQPIAWIGTGDPDAYLGDAGQAAEEDFHTVDFVRPPDMAGWRTYADAYRAHHFTHEPEPSQYSPFAYDAAGIILAAIQSAGSADRATVRQAIADTAGYAGVIGVYAGFDAHGDVIPPWGTNSVVQNHAWVPVDARFEFYAGQGRRLELGSTWGQTTTVTIPAPAVGQNLAITYTLLTGNPAPIVDDYGQVGQHPIRLQSSVALAVPVTLTINYRDEDIPWIQEPTLALFTRVGTDWVEAQPCGGYVRDMANNRIDAVLCHFSDYVLLGEMKKAAFLPIVEKRY